MKNRKVRVAVIGCGVIGPLHLKCYAALPDARIAAVCDLDEGRARAAAEKFGVPKWTTRAADVFSDPGVDAVSVCTDHASHCALSCAALAAGKHVLCEKSLARTSSDLRKMLAAAEARPDLVAAGVFQHRFEPVPRAVRKMIQGGTFGKLLTASGSLHCWRSPEYYAGDAWRGTVAGEGGSVLINQAIHFFDLLLWMSGGAESAIAFDANIGHAGAIETEDTVSVALRLRCGALGSFVATSASAVSWDNRLRFVGTKGAVELRDGKISAVEFPGDPRAGKRCLETVARAEAAAAKASAHEGKEYYGTGHMAQLADFVRAVRLGVRPFVTFADAAETDAFVFEAYRSARRASARPPAP